MEDFLIRTALLSDVDGIAELWASMQNHMEKSNRWIWRITEGGKGLVREKARQALLEKNSRVVVAEWNGGVVGCIYGYVLDRTDYSPKTVGVISKIYVAGGFRRRGVGRRLVKGLCEFFGGEGVGQVTLRCVVGNVEGEEFWRRLGLEPIITTASTHLDQLKKRLSR